MKVIFRFFLTFAMLGFSVTGTIARPVSQLQKKELVQLVHDMNEAVRRKDTSLVVDNMPEHLYKEMALRMHMTEMNLREDVKEAVQVQFDQLADNSYILDAAGIQYAETKDGTVYALIPTSIETDKNISEFMTLALYENTGWHLIYGGQKTVQNPVFLEIYPAFADVGMPVPRISRKLSVDEQFPG